MKILVVLLNLEAKELFLIFWSWEKHGQPLIWTLWEGLKCEYTKQLVVLYNGYHSHGWLSWPPLKPHRINSDIIIIRDCLKLTQGLHIFCLDLILLNFEICSYTFISLKMLTRSAHNCPKKKMNSGQTICRLPFFFKQCVLNMNQTTCHLG